MWGKDDSVFVLKVLQRSAGGINLKVSKELSDLKNDLACQPALHTRSAHCKSCIAQIKNSEKIQAETQSITKYLLKTSDWT